jgi:hypothetical protein
MRKYSVTSGSSFRLPIQLRIGSRHGRPKPEARPTSKSPGVPWNRSNLIPVFVGLVRIMNRCARYLRLPRDVASVRLASSFNGSPAARDFRSDTVTTPTKSMFDAMALSTLGDGSSTPQPQ